MQPLLQSILEHFCHFVRNLYPLAVPPTLSPLVPTLSNYQSAFGLFTFTCSRHFRCLESYDMWSFVTGFFQLTSYFQGSPVLFLRLNSISLYGATTFRLLVHQLMDRQLGFPSLGYCEQGCQEYLPTGFLEDLCFHFCQQSFNPEW